MHTKRWIWYTLSHTPAQESWGRLQFRGAIYSTAHPEEAVIFCCCELWSGLYCFKQPFASYLCRGLFPPSCISQQTQSSGFLDCFCFILVYVRYLQSSETQMSAKMIHNWDLSLVCIALQLFTWNSNHSKMVWHIQKDPLKSIALPQSIIHKWRQINLFLYFLIKNLSAVASDNGCNFW